MSNRTLGILAVVAAAMVVWATVQSQRASHRHVQPSGPTYLVQGLDPAGIGSIVIGKGDKPVKIERQGSQFVVVNEVNYPADTKQINDLITKTLDIKTSDVCTSDPKNHEDLEVTEAKARHVVKFFKPDGSLLTGIIIGKSQENGQDSYVRRVSDDTVYLAANVPWFRDRALDYVDQEIVSVKREDVNAVTVTTPEGSYTLRPGKGGEGVVLADLPADKKLKDADAKSVFNALTSLRFDDVNTPSQIEGLDFNSSYVCRLNDLTEYRLHLAQKGGKTYLKCEAQYTDPNKVTINPNTKDSPDELKKKEAKLLAQERAQKFTLRHKNWVYEIPDWKAKYLMMGRSALLEDVKKPAETKTAEPNQPAAGQPKPTQPEAKLPEQPKVEAGAKAAEPNQSPAAQPAPPAAREPNQPK
jgi:hypothetical protein